MLYYIVYAIFKCFDGNKCAMSLMCLNTIQIQNDIFDPQEGNYGDKELKFKINQNRININNLSLRAQICIEISWCIPF